jgi:hypothetical protein
LSKTKDQAQAGSSGKRKTAVVLLIVLIALSSLVGSYEFVLARQSTSPLSTAAGLPAQNYPLAAQLSVKVYDKGILQASVTENDDMVMNNFMNFLQSWLSYEGSSSASSTFTMTDNSGTARTLVGRDSAGTSTTCTWACEISTPPYAGGYIAVGTGTAAPARTDYKLASQYQSLVTVTQPTYDPSTGNIVFGVGIIAGTAASISEVGFFENWFIGGTSFADFLMFHDTFPTVAVAAGSTISVQYTVQLGSTAYNNNLGLILAAIFANALGTASSVMLTPTSGPSQSVSVYNVAVYSNSYNYYYNNNVALRADLSSGATGADSAIRVGTGSATSCPNNSGGFTQSRSATNLCQPVLSYAPVNSYVFSPYVAVTAVIPVTAAYSFTEAGYFQSFGSGTYSFLLIRNTFTTALALPADSSITSTFELSMS